VPVEDVFIRLSDGLRLAATLYLPDPSEGPQPCLLGALPYRKDDLTAGYRPEYERLCGEHGYAVCRVDHRGTGSSEGLAIDEYPVQEQRDLCEVIAWLADQEWCDGAIGMFGTSYSGFNALQIAAERPPALRAVVAIYATDDRATDDVHYMSGALRLLDQIDYCHYMTPMNALPPVPALVGSGWREAWRQRLDAHEPWLLTWLANPPDGPYWRQGSLRPDYDRISCPVLLVGGWADGYRNNSLRTVQALREAGRECHLLMGPWAHASTSTSRPGPRIDLVPEMARWWDRWLRGEPNGLDEQPPVTYFARRSTPPAPDLVDYEGEWRRIDWPWPEGTGTEVWALEPRGPLHARPDTGTAAWNSCAGHAPWGPPADQRHDDADSLVWERDWEGLDLLGAPTLRVRVVGDVPCMHVAARLCDVFPDGRSALVTRGLAVANAVPGEPVEVEVPLETTSWMLDPGHRLRLAVSVADWPNTVAPPEPMSLQVLGGTLELPLVTMASSHPPPEFVPGEAAEAVDAATRWRVEDDVLARLTRCTVEHGSSYEVPRGTVDERYRGSVEVDRTTWEQRASADVGFAVSWPEATVTAHSTLDLVVLADRYEVSIELEAAEDDKVVARRSWRRTYARASSAGSASSAGTWGGTPR
jgi:predicted acyl esterase